MHTHTHTQSHTHTHTVTHTHTHTQSHTHTHTECLWGFLTLKQKGESKQSVRFCSTSLPVGLVCPWSECVAGRLSRTWGQGTGGRQWGSLCPWGSRRHGGGADGSGVRVFLDRWAAVTPLPPASRWPLLPLRVTFLWSSSPRASPLHTHTHTHTHTEIVIMDLSHTPSTPRAHAQKHTNILHLGR